MAIEREQLSRYSEKIDSLHQQIRTRSTDSPLLPTVILPTGKKITGRPATLLLIIARGSPDKLMTSATIIKEYFPNTKGQKASFTIGSPISQLRKMLDGTGVEIVTIPPKKIDRYTINGGYYLKNHNLFI